LQINEENEKFEEGKATFFEKLNENSDLPKDVFEKEKTGLINEASGRGLGFVDVKESDRYTHPELEKLYQSVDRLTIPSSFDATQKGIKFYFNTLKRPPFNFDI
jgi:hypothetical protein